MYQVNQLKRKVLIMPDEVIYHSDLKEVDVKNLWSGIIIAEERFIKKMICKDLYYELRDKKNAVVDSFTIDDLTEKVNATNTGPAIVLNEGDIVNSIELLDSDDPYKELWYEYLWKICSECVLFSSMPNRYVQSKASGEMVNSPANPMLNGQEAASADLKTVRWKADKMLQDRIDPLIEAMREWLCDHKVSFPKFTCYECPKEVKNSVQKRTGWVPGIYDDEKCTDWNDLPTAN
jgi:hypothetical protein